MSKNLEGSIQLIIRLEITGDTCEEDKTRVSTVAITVQRIVLVENKNVAL